MGNTLSRARPQFYDADTNYAALRYSTRRTKPFAFGNRRLYKGRVKNVQHHCLSDATLDSKLHASVSDPKQSVYMSAQSYSASHPDLPSSSQFMQLSSVSLGSSYVKANPHDTDETQISPLDMTYGPDSNRSSLADDATLRSSTSSDSNRSSIRSIQTTMDAMVQCTRKLRRSFSLGLSLNCSKVQASFPLDASEDNGWMGEESGVTMRTAALGDIAVAGRRTPRQSLDSQTWVRRSRGWSMSAVDLDAEQRKDRRSRSLRACWDGLRRNRRSRSHSCTRSRSRSLSMTNLSSRNMDVYGRLHHGFEDVPYCLPCDEKEIDRLNQQHYVLYSLFGRNYLAPIEAPTYALEVGAGSGIWQMEMATEFPDTQFIGVDIAPMQPVDCLPSNCQFEAADLMNGLPYQDYRFDYVHQRMLSLAVPKGRWENALREHARVCRPGGWFELIETDWLPRDGGDAAKRLSKYIQQLYEVRGCDPTEITNLEPMMKEVGFEDVRRLMVQLPLGEWGGSIGIEAGQVVLGAWEGMRGQLVGHGIASCEELDEVFAQLEDELVKRPMWVCLAVYIGQRGAN